MWSDTSSSGPSSSNLLYAGAGAGGVLAVQKVNKAASRANWALGIGVALVALSLFSSSDLNADQTTYQGIATSVAALTFTTGGGVTGEEVSALRAQVGQLANAGAKTSYDANLFSFNGAPTPQPFPVQIAAITPVAQIQNNNNNVILLAVVALAVIFIILS